MNGKNMRSLDQERATHAWEKIQEVKKLKPDDKYLKSFKAQIKKTPVRIVNSGLGQALAFLEAKDYAPDLRNALSDWINRQRYGGGGNGDDSLLRSIIKRDAQFLRYATAESLTYLEWMVRFAEAEGLTGGDSEGNVE